MAQAQFGFSISFSVQSAAQRKTAHAVITSKEVEAAINEVLQLNLDFSGQIIKLLPAAGVHLLTILKSAQRPKFNEIKLKLIEAQVLRDVVLWGPKCRHWGSVRHKNTLYWSHREKRSTGSKKKKRSKTKR